MRFFSLYQYIAPAILFPLAYWLFLRRYAGDHTITAFMLAIPITFSYVVPALGMNWLRLWAMRTRVRIGAIRPHHGFLFGSASSLFALLCLDPLAGPLDALEALRAGVVLGSVVGFWNWLYDLLAIRVGFIQVFNRPYARGEGAAAIATDYAPVLFGSFGFAYGVWIRIAESWLVVQRRGDLFWPLLAGALVTALALPVLAFVLQSYCVHGESGLRPYEGER
jgi:hypothetical protein